MSIKTSENGHAIHYPANPARFEFDQEVSQLFPDMAKKSIPLFYETHELHASLAAKWINDSEADTVDILDLGASRGAFLAELFTQYDLSDPRYRIRAVDYSSSMVEYLLQDFPTVDVGQLDLSSEEFRSDCRKYDIINCTYVVQFLKPEYQVGILGKITRMLKPGGVLFYGHKGASAGPAGRMLHDQYIRFRVSQGYSMEEIEAKTAALKNSMWPMSDENFVYYVNKFGLEVHPTTRWTVFSNYMCIKGL